MRFLALPAVLALLALLPAAAFCDPPSESSPAYKVWKDGQAAMDGDRFEEAIGQFQLSLRLDPKLVQNHLSLAAAYLALGQDRQSLPHMAAYLAACPDHFLIRWHYAEVLMHSDQPAEGANAARTLRGRGAAASPHCRRPPDRLPHPADGDRRATGRRLYRALAPRHRAVPAGAKAIRAGRCEVAAGGGGTVVQGGGRADPGPDAPSGGGPSVLVSVRRVDKPGATPARPALAAGGRALRALEPI